MTEIKVENDIEAEVQARVDFKLNELLTAIKNTININYQASLQSGSPKHYYYWEAFNRFEEMIKKETEMKVPCDEMTKLKIVQKRDSAVKKIMERLCKKGSTDYYEKESFVVGVVENLLNI